MVLHIFERPFLLFFQLCVFLDELVLFNSIQFGQFGFQIGSLPGHLGVIRLLLPEDILQLLDHAHVFERLFLLFFKLRILPGEFLRIQRRRFFCLGFQLGGFLYYLGVFYLIVLETLPKLHDRFQEFERLVLLFFKQSVFLCQLLRFVFIFRAIVLHGIALGNIVIGVKF